ncbi:cytochrome-c peroxidase [Rhizosaccharibacter radicis]|uniref:Cytochrome-c peroxidase n=1 Tax=Rhizosaccharibacter radicis TaxID=2782605 RepID=A0ABT1VWL6_9PROT|nr:cytochrome-c peroxidase [Acetobacteraceae bacterium KSS12]
MVLAGFLIAPAGVALGQGIARCRPSPDGANPCPRPLLLPREQPLSAMAQIGRSMFFDKQLSGNGRLACASCHDPAHHYGPSADRAVFLGGDRLDQQGRRAIPSLTYLDRIPGFSIGPDLSADDAPPPAIVPPPPGDAAHAPKSAINNAASATNLVPQGGLFWDGRADSLQQQVLGPLYDHAEMAATPATVLRRIQHAPYTAQLQLLLGPGGSSDPQQLLSEAQFALARFQIENRDFHPYSSKFDAWFQGKARFTPLEREGYLLFNDPAKGNCAACHVDTASKEGLPPVFTDHQYEALGAPRNRELLANRDPAYYDLGVCDRVPDGRQTLAPYCGMFATPSLRNSATRHVFFHNGVFHTLRQVVDFYVLRDIEPGRFYPRGADGGVRAYDDLPPDDVKNLDRTDAPFGGRPGDKAALDGHERDAIVTFLGTLTDR